MVSNNCFELNDCHSSYRCTAEPCKILYRQNISWKEKQRPRISLNTLYRGSVPRNSSSRTFDLANAGIFLALYVWIYEEANGRKTRRPRVFIVDVREFRPPFSLSSDAAFHVAPRPIKPADMRHVRSVTLATMMGSRTRQQKCSSRRAVHHLANIPTTRNRT